MDSDDEVLRPSPSGSPPLLHQPLKRLKKASTNPDERPPPPPVPDPLHGEGEGVDGLDPLFGGISGHSTGCDAGDYGFGAEGAGGEGLDSGKKPAKRRLCLDGEEENGEKNRRRKRKGKESGDGDEGAHKESVREKRRLEKERETYLQQLHAESQKLLRETRNASFKFAPVVQKPISSVLEKIRLRKVEMLKRSNDLYNPESPPEVNNHENEDLISETCCSQKGKSEESLGKVQEDNTMDNIHNNAEGVTNEDIHYGLGSNSEGRDAPMIHDSSAVDVQESFPISPVKQEENGPLRRQPASSMDPDSPESNVPCLKISSPKDETTLSEDISSDDEDYDKENSDPRKDRAGHVDLFGRSDIAKRFVDDEAEEEDDSDHDLMRFPEDDEDDGSEDCEEINDVIATAYEEMPVDQERRNQLHQEWLEQQDAAETNKVLQKLKRHQRKEVGSSCLPDDDSIEELDEQTEEEFLYEDVLANAARENSKKAKQMMAQTFDAKDDGFVSSDDEETENRISRQRILEQAEKHTSILSPEDNANSREVFSLIKKLNIAPDSKKRIKPASTIYEPLHLCGNSNSSSKSSFIGRVTGSSLQSSHKQSSTTFKGFIFGRDDSNSKCAISKTEDSCDTDQAEAQRRGTGSAKFTGSQLKPTSKLDSETDAGAGPSLFEILRRSSAIYDQKFKASIQKNGAVSETQAVRQMTAFKLKSKGPKRST